MRFFFVILFSIATTLGAVVPAPTVGTNGLIVVFNVKARPFLAQGDGVTDDSAAITSAIAAAATGDTLYFPPGRYILDNIVMNKDLNWLGPGATLFHKTNGINHMITFTATQTGIFEVARVDGNQANQTSRLVTTMSANGNGWTIRGVDFTNTVIAAIYDFRSPGVVNVQNCTFRNMAEHGGLAGEHSSAINVSYAGGTTPTNSVCRYNISDCFLIQDNNPSAPGKAPGGFIFAGSITNSRYISPSVVNCYFSKIGQTFAGNHIGGVYPYEACRDVVISGNVFIDSKFEAIDAQNCFGVVISGNIVEGFDDDASPYGFSHVIAAGVQRTAGASSTDYGFINISDNIVNIESIHPGMRVYGRSSPLDDRGHDITVTGNFVQNTLGRAFTVQNVDRRLNVSGNTFSGINQDTGAGGGSELQNFFGEYISTGNEYRGVPVTGGNGFFANSGITGNLTFVGDRFDNNTVAGRSALVIGSTGNIALRACEFRGTNGAAFQILDAAVLTLEASTVLGGSVTFDYPDYTIVTGNGFQGSGSPESVVPAMLGTRYLDTSGNAIYWKNTASGNTGWGGVVNSVSGTANEVEASPTVGNVVVGLPDSPIITTSIGVGGTAASAEDKLLVTSTADGLQQVQFDLLGTGTSTYGQILLRNPLVNFFVGLGGTNHATLSNQALISVSGADQLRYNVSEGTNTHRFQVSSVDKFVIGNFGVEVPGAMRVVGVITNSALTASRLVGTGSDQTLVSLTATTTEGNHLSGVTTNLVTTQAEISGQLPVAGTNIILTSSGGRQVVSVATNYFAGTNIVISQTAQGFGINVATNVVDSDGYTVLPTVTTSDGTATPIYTNTVANNSMVTILGEVDVINADATQIAHRTIVFSVVNTAGTLSRATSFPSQINVGAESSNYAVSDNNPPPGTAYIITVQNNGASPSDVLKWQMRYKVITLAP